jgi:hypothetical protein
VIELTAGRTLITQSVGLYGAALALNKARSKHPGEIVSPHEGIAVIREEYLEAEAEVFASRLDRAALYLELTQLAAMCVRVIEDLGLDGHS